MRAPARRSSLGCRVLDWNRRVERQWDSCALDLNLYYSATPLLLSFFSATMSNSDSTTTIAELRKLVADFVAERDWSQFHSPKNVSMALAIEAAELMEHFQWLTTDASRELAEQPEKLAEVGEELADVIGYSFALANELGLDISEAVRAKMVKNAQKYPAEKYRGRYERPQK
jgi:dCTP diphosphatase